MAAGEGLLFVLFGATGDLARRKIVPALFRLFLDGELPGRFSLLCLGRRDLRAPGLWQEYRKVLEPSHDEDRWRAFVAHLRYQRVDLNRPDDYRRVAGVVGGEMGTGERRGDLIFYLAVPPELFIRIAQGVGEAGLAQPRDRTRIVIEKPIGRDLASFRSINSQICRYFEERQIFRIDHFLGKEMVRDLLALRFANPLFEPLWNRRYIDHVTITVAESGGVGERGGYYERAGALRDMIQNHLLQLLCLVAMEPPASRRPEEICGRKIDVMEALRPIPTEAVPSLAARGQYAGGWIGAERVGAYREEKEVESDSRVETFAAITLHVDNWRWAGVPFYLRSGKRLARDLSEIALRFVEVPHAIFAGVGREAAQLIVRIEPEPGIALRLALREPGYSLRLRPAELRFDARSQEGNFPGAYETLLREVLAGDPTLFMRADQVEAAWRLLDPVLSYWEAHPPDDFPNYPAGSWGPEASQRLIAADGRAWDRPSRG